MKLQEKDNQERVKCVIVRVGCEKLLQELRRMANRALFERKIDYLLIHNNIFFIIDNNILIKKKLPSIM